MGEKQAPSGTHAARAGGTLGDHRGSPETTRKAEAEPTPRPFLTGGHFLLSSGSVTAPAVHQDEAAWAASHAALPPALVLHTQPDFPVLPASLACSSPWS